MKKTINYVKCPECGVHCEASWNVSEDTGKYIHTVLYMDSMLSDEQRKRAEPWTQSHIHPLGIKICPKCDHDFAEDEHTGYCLVNHGDETACLSCPECHAHIKEAAVWHKWEWTREDLIPKEKEIEEPKQQFFNFRYDEQ